MNIKTSIVADAFFWFDCDLYDLVYDKVNNNPAFAFSAICYLFCQEHILLNNTLTPFEVVKYFNAFTEEQVREAIENHKRFITTNTTYAFAYKQMLNKAKTYNHQAIELNKKYA